MPTHHARERHGFSLVGNQEHLARERSLLPVQRHEFLAFCRAANDDRGTSVAASQVRRDICSTLKQMIIERVQRLPGFEHDIIRHIHDVVDASNANFFERTL